MKVSNEATKRQKIPHQDVPGLPPGLWIVATPIGNLSDMTERARRALELADWIACEDTRRTRELVHALKIHRSRETDGGLRRFDRHTDEKQVERWVREMIERGESVALVSDAGTPGVSDPGALFVKKASEAGVRITPVPGVSALSTLMSISGWPDVESFSFQGFLPRKSSDIIQAFQSAVRLAQVAERPVAAVWFESPERIVKSLEILSGCLDRTIGAEALVCKELTKLHEKHFRGGLAEVHELVRQEVETEGARGEWCIALSIPGAKVTVSSSSVDQNEWKNTALCMLEAEVKASDIARIMSKRCGVERGVVYEFAIACKKNEKKD